MSCDCHVIWGQSLLVPFSFFVRGRVNLVGEKETIDTSVGVWKGKERGRKGGGREAHVCMHAVHVYTSTPKHMHIFTCTYVCIMQCPCGWVSVVTVVIWDQTDTSSHCLL